MSFGFREHFQRRRSSLDKDSEQQSRCGRTVVYQKTIFAGFFCILSPFLVVLVEREEAEQAISRRSQGTGYQRFS